MKLFKLSVAVFVILAIGFGLVWTLVGHFASPPPSGEGHDLVTGWPKLTEGVRLGQVSGVGADSHGNVIVFRRAERVWSGEKLDLDQLISSPTVLILDSETGALMAQWGANAFVMPHGLIIDDEDHIWLTDVGLHQVFKFDRMGNLLMVLGERGVAGDDATHFNQPTDVAVAPDGSFFVSDGYVNSRVVKFSPEGRFLATWGASGAGPGQFNVPHSIALDKQGRVYVADRGNARLQIFDSSSGQFIAEWKGAQIGRPWAVRIGEDGSIYVVDGGDQRVWLPDRARILKFDPSGNLLALFGSYGKGPGQFTWPHAVAVAPDGALYVGEVSTGMRVQKFIRRGVPGE